MFNIIFSKNFGSNSSGINVLHVNEPNLIDIVSTTPNELNGLHTRTNVNNMNPFGSDNFTPSNFDNDLFGLEFDKLRNQNDLVGQSSIQQQQQSYANMNRGI